MKRIIAAVAALMMLVVCLASCQLSELINRGDDDTTPADGADTTTQAPAETTPVVEYDPVDFNEVDPLQYITLGEYKGVAVAVTYTALTEDEYDEAISALLEENSYYTQITDRATAEGDTINMDFRGFVDGEQFEGGTADGQTITLNDNSGYIEGFADGLIGATPGTTVTLELTFPEDYYEELAGKAVTFEVTVNYIQGELITPELNDEFVNTYTNGDYTTVAAFEEYYRQALQAELDATAESDAANSLWSSIVDATQVKEYPEQHVMYYYGELMAQYEYYASYYSVDLATVLSLYGATEESIMEDARLYAKQDMVIYAIVRQEGIEVTEDEYAAKLSEIALSAGATADAVEAYYGKDYIMESMLWDKVIRQLYDWAVVTEA